MIKKILTGLLFVVSFASANQDSLQQWLDSTNMREKFNMLSSTQQESLKRAFAEFDLFLADAQGKLEVLSDKHKSALQIIKDMLAVKTLSFSLSFAGQDEPGTQS